MGDRDVHPHEMPYDPLDAFLDELRASAAATPDPVVGDALATLFAEGAEPVAAPPRHRFGGTWSRRAAVAGAVAGVAFGGLGVAGALPAAVQHRVARVVEHVGVQLPDPAAPTTAPGPVTPPTTVHPNGGTSVPPTGDDTPANGSKDDQGDGGEGHRGSNDGNRGNDQRPSTTTTTERHDGDGGRGGDNGSSATNRGDDRNSAATTVVRSGDGSQDVSRLDRGGSSE